MIISISGFISSGKDTVGNHLVDHYGFVKLSFAAALKDALAAIFGWDRNLLEGNTPESREWRETVDKWWAKRLKKPNFTPRFALQNVGTEVLRTHFHDEIWVAALEHRIEAYTNDIVITDVRFPNEIKMLQKHKAVMVQVMRGKAPNWEYEGKQAARGNKEALEKMKLLGIHPTEYMWLATRFNDTLLNNGTLDTLYKQVNELVQFSKVVCSSQSQSDSFDKRSSN